MKKIEGSPKNLKQLLQNTKYSIHYYRGADGQVALQTCDGHAIVHI